MKYVELAKMMGHSSPEFTELTFKKNSFGMVARYIDDQESEVELLETFESRPLVYALIAMNEHLTRDYSYEAIYLKLVNEQPTTQEDFDIILASFD